MAINFGVNAITLNGEHADILSEARAIIGDANVLIRLENAMYALANEVQTKAKSQLYEDYESLPPEAQEAVKIQIESAKGPKAAAAPPVTTKAAVSGPAQPTKPKRRAK